MEGKQQQQATESRWTTITKIIRATVKAEYG